MQTLFERFGKAPSIHSAVDLFYDKVLGDEQMQAHFSETDVRLQQCKMAQFLAKMCHKEEVEFYDYKLRLAHRRLRLSEADFNLAMTYFLESLEELEVSHQLQGEIIALMQSLKPEIIYESLPELPEHAET